MSETNKTHIVVDMLNDFISGTMACLNAKMLYHTASIILTRIRLTKWFMCATHIPSTIALLQGTEVNGGTLCRQYIRS